MGCGLGIKAQGTHAAFAAGTGILVFVDLIAHIILRLVDPGMVNSLNESGEELPDQIDLDNFKFKLFASFANEEEAIAMELINALKNLC